MLYAVVLPKPQHIVYFGLKKKTICCGLGRTASHSLTLYGAVPKKPQHIVHFCAAVLNHGI